MGVSRLLALVAAFMLASVVLVACEPTLRQASGVVMEVDSPSPVSYTHLTLPTNA